MELIIHDDWILDRVNIYIREEVGDRSFIIGYDGRNIVRTDITENRISGKEIKVKPLLSLESRMYSNVLELFTNEANKKGIRTENENHLKGKLEATEKHLEDMRHAFHNLIGLVK